MRLWTVLLTAVLALGSLDAEAARRLGGGASFGRQSPNVTQRQSAPPAQAPANPQQAQQAQRQAQPGATPNAAGQQAPRRPWAGMLGGLAAGLGLAWLANALGLGPAFAQFMLFALLALVLLAVVGMVLRARRPAVAGAAPAWQGSAGPAPGAVVTPRQYNPEKVGNDASARPWEQPATGFDEGRPSAGGLRIGSGLEGSQSWGVPAGFDTQGFVAAAKRNFLTLQEAWDRSDLQTLRSMMTDDMLEEIRAQLAERDAQPAASPQQTEVVMLEAQLLGIEDTGSDWLASVEFSGLIREEPSAGPSPFREVWNMAKPKAGGQGWLVAGVQALQ